MEILYKVHNNLYVNLTNKCPCACTFCLRQNMDHVGESKSLWLEREPSAEEVIAEFSKFDMSKYKEVVFCGFGEPTEAFEVLKKSGGICKGNVSNANPHKHKRTWKSCKWTGYYTGAGRFGRYGIHQPEYAKCWTDITSW